MGPGPVQDKGPQVNGRRMTAATIITQQMVTFTVPAHLQLLLGHGLHHVGGCFHHLGVLHHLQQAAQQGPMQGDSNYCQQLYRALYHFSINHAGSGRVAASIAASSGSAGTGRSPLLLAP